MVLSRALCALLLIAGCGQSLFDSHGGGGRDGGGGGDDGGGDGDGDVPDTCAAPCLADAAADFDGSPGGKGDHWRYLDDHRDHTWTAMMTGPSGGRVGADMRNSFKSCADDPSADACKALPGALLVSTAGRSTPADPAIEYRSAEARVIRIAFRAHVAAGGAGHAIRLYRNSREDVLFTLPAAAGTTVEHQVTVDALPGDRFLVAVAPDGAGGAVALHAFVSDARTTFPATCQLAVPFSVPGTMANTVDDLCRGELRSFSSGAPASPSLLPGPYVEQGMAAYLENSHYEAAEPLPLAGAMTVQLWLRTEGSGGPDGWVFSNIDVDIGRGIALRLQISGSSKLEVSVVQNTNPITYTGQSAPIATPFGWHFVRVVHASGAVSICVDGVKAGGGALAGPSDSVEPVSIGRRARDAGTYFVGDVDDARVFLEALPCE